MGSIGASGVFVQQRNTSGGGGGTLTGANDGLSLFGTIARLGQTIAQLGDPAKLLENREVPQNNFSFGFRDGFFGIGIGSPQFPLHQFKPAANVVSNGTGLNDSAVFVSNPILIGNVLAGNSGISSGVFSTVVSLNANQTINNGTDFASLIVSNTLGNTAAFTLIITQTAGGTRAWANTKSSFNLSSFVAGSTISHVSNFHLAAIFAPGAAGTITNYFGLLIEDQFHLAPGITVTNKWGIYQEGGADRNFLNGQTGIGQANPDASAKLQVDSVTQGFLPPRMTTVQKNAIAAPLSGLVVYDSTLNKLSLFTGVVWETVTSV